MRFRRSSFLALSLVLSSTWPAAAMEVAPPEAVEAVRVADSGDLERAYEVAGTDALASDLVTWLRLRDGAGRFDEYVLFLDARPDWPERDRLLARAEVQMPRDLPPEDVVGWFGDRAPETGEGAVRLAEALTRVGRIDPAKEVVVAAWRDLRLSDRGQDMLVESFGDVLAPHHAARVDTLLWRWRVDEARRMLDLLDDDQRALAEARIAYIRRENDLEEKVKAVPAALADAPGLAYDRYNWLAAQGRQSDAIAILQPRSVSAESLGEPFRWSGWRRSLARWKMREGEAQLAYELAASHFLTEGESYVDLEWLAGFLQLTDLGNAEAALTHFEAGLAQSEGPISLSRMHYWVGRAQEALGATEASRQSYAAAAQHQTAFYGLLASEKVGKPLDPALTGRSDPADWEESELLGSDLVLAALTLLEAGERGAAVPFFAELGKTLTEADLARLGALLAEKEEAYFTVLLGKTAVARGALVPSIYYPLHPLAEMDLPAPPELSLSIARRESEFNAGVGSPVGALGLMQLMPATAQEVAGFLDLPYERARLTTDWAYNARLGTKYLAMLEEEFGPSPVMISAGYNAGPSRPKTWMDERGDPRLGEVDVVDWIEHIPFRETRNYVMRVTESLPVYQARLSGNAGPVAFTRLLVGEKPIVRPEARPAPRATVSTRDAPPPRAVARPASPSAPEEPSAPEPVRPVGRPGG